MASQYKNTREQREEIQELKKQIFSIECQLTEQGKKNGPRPGEQFFFQVHALPLQKFHNQIAGLRAKIYSIEQEPRRQVREREAREREAQSKTPEFQMRSIRRQINDQEKICGLLNGCVDRLQARDANLRLTTLKKSLKTMENSEKLAGMTEEEKDSMYERLQEEAKERQEAREREVHRKKRDSMLLGRL